jgi:hypothetical protein
MKLIPPDGWVEDGDGRFFVRDDRAYAIVSASVIGDPIFLLSPLQKCQAIEAFCLLNGIEVEIQFPDSPDDPLTEEQERARHFRRVEE